MHTFWRPQCSATDVPAVVALVPLEHTTRTPSSQPGRASRHARLPESARAPCAQKVGSPQSCLQAGSWGGKARCGMCAKSEPFCRPGSCLNARAVRHLLLGHNPTCRRLPRLAPYPPAGDQQNMLASSSSRQQVAHAIHRTLAQIKQKDRCPSLKPHPPAHQPGSGAARAGPRAAPGPTQRLQRSKTRVSTACWASVDLRQSRAVLAPHQVAHSARQSLE